MPKPFDAATKDLIGWRPADYLALAGLPVPADPADVVMTESELSTVTAAADKIIRVDGVAGGPYLAVVEFQSGYDPRLDDRVMMYNAVARWRSGLPVRNVVYQLRRAAVSRGTTGRVVGPGLTFSYELIPVWTLSAAALLSGPIGTVPLALLVDQPADALPATIERVWQRLKADVAGDKLKDVMAQSAVLIGLRYDDTLAERLMQSVLDMEDSSVYQAIIRKGIDRGLALGREEGREEGREQGREQGRESGERDLLFRLAVQRFGEPTEAVLTRVSRADAAELTRLTGRLLSAVDWAGFLAG